MHRRYRSATVVTALTIVACSACGAGDESFADPTEESASAATSSAAPIKGLAGKCLDVSNGSTADGAKVQLYTCNGTAAQSWSYQNGAFVGPGGKCLDVAAANAASGTKVQLHTCNGTAAQRWTLDGSAIVGLGGKCLDVTQGNSANGTQIQIWSCTGGSNQAWSVGSTTTTPPTTTGAGLPTGNFTSPVTGHTYKKILAEDFTTNASTGAAFASTYANSFCYGAENSEYSESTLSASGGNMVVNLAGKGMQGVFAAGGCKTAWTGITYGVFSIRFKAVKATGYGGVAMLWPVDDVWGDGEVDFAEGGFGGTLTINQHGTGCGYACGTNVYRLVSSASFQTWNTATTEWSPSGMVYYYNGVKVGSYSGATPYNPHRFTMQMAGSGASGQFLVDWVAEYTY